MSKLSDFFDQNFEVRISNAPSLMEWTQRIRYQVYCLDLHFEDPDQFPDGREFDAYDERATHCLVRHRPTGADVGSVRLILPDRDTPFPVEHHCGNCFLERFPTSSPERRFVGEPSRLLLTSDFRRRRGEYVSPEAIGEDIEYDRRMIPDRRRNGSDPTPSVTSERSERARDHRGDPEVRRTAPDARASGERRSAGDRRSQRERRIMPHVLLILIRAAMEMSYRHGIRYWYAIMEPALLRKLHRLGIVFESVGPRLELGHRIRQPCRTHLGDLLACTKNARADVWDLITNKGEFDFVPHRPDDGIGHRTYPQKPA